MIFVQEILDRIDNLKNLCIDSETEVCSGLCSNDKCAVQILYNKLIKHGRWKIVYYDNVPTLAYCSRCDQVLQFTRETETMPNYCPNCGTKMDEVEE